MIAGALGKGIQQHAFLGRGGLAILRGELLEQFASALKIHSFSHACLLGNSPIRNRCAKTTATRPIASRKICLSEPMFSTSARFAKEHEPGGDLGAELENISSECGSLKWTKADFS
jgi:hypothetical protein